MIGAWTWMPMEFGRHGFLYGQCEHDYSLTCLFSFLFFFLLEVHFHVYPREPHHLIGYVKLSKSIGISRLLR